jgi:hypothetical protein
MRKNLYPGILAGLMLIGFSVACRLLSFPQILQPETETPTAVSTSSPTETKTPLPTASPANTKVPTPTQLVVLVPPTPKFAPFCQPSSASVVTPIACQVPIAKQSSTFCESKVPYNLILVNPGSTFETTTENITCTDAGVNGDKLIVTCTGPMAIPFELKVCDPACVISPFESSTTACPQDLHYNELLGCCEREPIPVDGNCVVLNLKTNICTIACNQFTNATTCDANGYACVWNDEFKECSQRK